MQLTGKRIFSAVMLLGCAVTVYQVLSKPQPVALPLAADAARANAASFDHKIEQLESSRPSGDAPGEVHFSSDEVNAGMAESMGALPAVTPTSNPAQQISTTPASSSSLNPAVGLGDVKVKGYEVKLEGDVARGQFTIQLAGKDIYVTLAGHLGSQDGYVTFDPTEFKVGDLSIPVSLVNSALQKKLAEQREQLRLPEGIGSLRVENGELVITRK
jgi:hypothetical protein